MKTLKIKYTVCRKSWENKSISSKYISGRHAVESSCTSLVRRQKFQLSENLATFLIMVI